MGEENDDVKFKRYLYLMTDSQHCVVQRKCDLKPDVKIDSLMNLIAENKTRNIIEIIETANNDDSLPDRKVLFLALVICLHANENKELKTAAYDALIKVCKTIDELFLFLKYNHVLSKTISHGVKRVVSEYYLKTDKTQLYDILTQQNSYHGRTHHDIIRLAHLKSDNLIQNILLSYACKDLEAAKKKVTDNKLITPEIEDILKKLENLDKFKHCQDEKQAANMIKENRYTIQQLPSRFLKSQIVWETLIPHMDITDVIKELNRFHKLSFLKGNNPILAKVIEVITDVEKCKVSKIHPTEVLIHMKTMERGKPLDPHLKNYLETLRPDEKPLTKKVDVNTQTTTIVNSKEKQENIVTKNNAIVNALNKLLHSSFRNITPTGRRVMVTIDLMQARMTRPCFGTKLVNCLEAASLIAMSFLKSEKDVTIASFNGDCVNIIQIAKGMTYNQVLQKLKETNSDYVLLSKPFLWATEKNKHIDVFINVLYAADTMTRYPKEVKERLAKEGRDNVLAAYKKYKNKMKLVNTKLLNITLGGRQLMIADNNSKGVLDVSGFNANLPKIIESFCKGSIQ